MKDKTMLELPVISFLKSTKTSLTPASLKPSGTTIKAFQQFILHITLLLRKNFILQKRSLKTTMAQYWAPLVACYLLLLLQNLGNDLTSGVVIESQIDTVGKIPRCFGPPSDQKNCTSLAYAVAGPAEPWIHSVMDYVAKAHGFKRDEDMIYLDEIRPQEFNDYLNANINRTQIGVIFCTDKWETEEGLVIPCQPDSVTDHKLAFYSIVYNASVYLSSPVGDDYRRSLPKDPVTASLKLWLDNGIIAYFSKDLEATGDEYIELDPNDMSLPRVEMKTQDYPKTHFRFYIGTDVVTAMGGLMLFLPYIIQFVVTVMDIMKEKHHKLRQGLSVMGMSVSAYWISWFITSIISNLILTASTIIAGFLFNYKFFTDTPLPILFALFFGLGLALQSVAFALTTLCSNMTIAYVSTYSILLLWIMIELIVGNINFIPMMFVDEFPVWFLPFKFLLRFMPAFNYSGIFGQITLYSGSHFELDRNQWMEGPGFTYADLGKSFKNDVAGVPFHVPPASEFFTDLFMNIVFYMACTWYFDNIISHNRGSSKSPLFFLQGLQLNPFRRCMNYRRLRKTSYESEATQASDNYNELTSNEQGTTGIAPNRNTYLDSKGLHVSALNKIYQKSFFGCKNKKDLHAVKDLCLDAYDGELLSILGHNGAGKTTLIGVLTGILNPTSGTAMMGGYDIRYEMDSIRRIMGVCPQFDILWDELTAEEHLQIFAKLKGVPDNKIPDEIDVRLREVNLIKYKNAMSGTFSGGMKRRLSMAIAFIGDPRIVFLDEPTTGMDPKNRRHIWELILNMKKNRVVVLTTHAMEEADALSDRIAVMAGGSLKCVGAPLYLKNTYGDGYKLSIVVEKENIEDVKADLRLIVPSGRVLDCSGGSILVGVPLTKTDELQMFLRIVEEKENDDLARKFRTKVKDWGLSHTTLEEVFMKVTRN